MTYTISHPLSLVGSCHRELHDISKTPISINNSQYILLILTETHEPGMNYLRADTSLCMYADMTIQGDNFKVNGRIAGKMRLIFTKLLSSDHPYTL